MRHIPTKDAHGRQIKPGMWVQRVGDAHLELLLVQKVRGGVFDYWTPKDRFEVRKGGGWVWRFKRGIRRFPRMTFSGRASGCDVEIIEKRKSK